MLNCSQFADNDSKIWKIKKNVLGMHTVFKYNVFKFFSGLFVSFLVTEKLQNILKKKLVRHCTMGWHQVCYDCHFELKYKFLDFNNDEALNQFLHTSLLIFKICSAAGKSMNKIWMIMGDFSFCLLCLLHILKDMQSIDLKINRICPLTTHKMCTKLRERIIHYL